MPQFFVKAICNVGEKVKIEGSDASHLVRVRRAKAGDQMRIRDENGLYFEGEISSIDNGIIEVSVLHKIEESISNTDLVLCMALLKQGNFEEAVQRSVEVGVSTIQPLSTERTIVSLGDKEFAKMNRWKKIVSEASKQSMRSDIPFLENALSFEECVLRYKEYPVCIIAHTASDGMNLVEHMQNKKSKSAVLMVGPEGGFSPREIDFAVQNGFVQVRFGNSHMRAETAAVVLSAVVKNLLHGSDT